MHHDMSMPLAALAPSPSRPGHAGSHLIRALFLVGVSSAATPPSRDPANLLIKSRPTPQPTGPSHDTAQSNKPPLLPAACVYAGGSSSSGIRTEPRLGKRPSCDTSAPSISHLHHSRHTRSLLSILSQWSTCLLTTPRHGSVHRQEPLRL
jgi:hypothetical protein